MIEVRKMHGWHEVEKRLKETEFFLENSVSQFPAVPSFDLSRGFFCAIEW